MTTTKATKATSKSTATEARRLLAMIVRVNKLRDEIRALAGDPTIEGLMSQSAYNDGGSAHEIGCVDIPLHQIVDGAAVAYARLVSNVE